MSSRWRRATCLAGAVCLATAIAPIPAAHAQSRCTGTAASSPDLMAVPTVAERVLRFRDAWPMSNGAGVTIAIIDTGVADHPRLGGVADGGDVTGGAGAFHDCDAHGTFVAGLAAGRPGDDSFAGVAPGARVLSIRHTTGEEGTLASLASAVDSAVGQGARVINISLTSCAPPGMVPPGAPEITAAVQRAEESGAVVVAASGNIGGECPDGAVAWPAILDEVIAVTAVDLPGDPGARHADEPDAVDHAPAGYAVAADWVDVAAPGGPVAGPSPNGETWADLHVNGSNATPIVGTSFAAPLVSGTAALILSRAPETSPARVRELILATASPAPSTTGVGAGIVDPVAAVARTGIDSVAVAGAGAVAGEDAATGEDASAGPHAAAPPTPAARVDHAPTHRIMAIALLTAVAVIGRALWLAGASSPVRERTGPSPW